MNESIQMLNRLLDASALRQRVLANNLANADTPRFKRKDVEFREMLTKAVDSANASRELSVVQPKIIVDTAAPSRPDGNSVSMQRELGEMTENSLLYQFATRAVSRKFDTIRKAIKGR
jgi:flagellar basal-body rod protein FlgB